MVMKNVTTYGMSDTQIKNVRSKFDDEKMVGKYKNKFIVTDSLS